MGAASGVIELDDLPDGLVVAGADGAVEAANLAAAAMLGTRRADLLGAKLAEVMALDDLEGNDWFSCTQPYDGFPLRRRLSEQTWHHADGRELLVTARLVRRRPAGTVQRVVVSLRDARARAHNDRERSDLVATVAHELRSPLTGVKGFTATLLSKWDRFSDSQRLLLLQTVDSDADRLGRLVTELLDAARIDSGRMRVRREPLSPVAQVERVLANIGAGSGRSVDLRVEGEMPTVWGDSDRLVQVFTNLVENAFVHGGGRVSVLVQRKARRGADGVEVCVDDAGPGFPPAQRHRVFNKFWHNGTTGGSGLGLYIVRGVVEAHAGSVAIAESPSGGARLQVWLPLNEPAVLRD